PRGPARPPPEGRHRPRRRPLERGGAGSPGPSDMAPRRDPPPEELAGTAQASLLLDRRHVRRPVRRPGGVPAGLRRGGPGGGTPWQGRQQVTDVAPLHPTRPPAHVRRAPPAARDRRVLCEPHAGARQHRADRLDVGRLAPAPPPGRRRCPRPDPERAPRGGAGVRSLDVVPWAAGRRGLLVPPRAVRNPVPIVQPIPLRWGTGFGPALSPRQEPSCGTECTTTRGSRSPWAASPRRGLQAKCKRPAT